MSALTKRHAQRIQKALATMPEADDLNRACRRTPAQWEAVGSREGAPPEHRTAVVIAAILEDITEGNATEAHMAALTVIRKELVK